MASLLGMMLKIKIFSFKVPIAKSFLVFIILLLLQGCSAPSTYSLKVKQVKKPFRFPSFLRSIGRLDFASIDESSGLIRSRNYPGVFWTHNDSGDSARIFPISRKGSLIRPDGNADYQGVFVLGAKNTDWEDIAADQHGNLILGDFGNNFNNRRDLSLYIIPEPNPKRDNAARILKHISFKYPDQRGFPPKQKNFDAEALFAAHGKIYLLTKHRSDTFTKLYRMDHYDRPGAPTLNLVDVFDIGGYVTAADVSPDWQRLVVLTYNAIWLFNQSDGSDRYFDGSISWLPIRAGQCEAVCFSDENTLLITNEERDVFEVKLDDLISLR